MIDLHTHTNASDGDYAPEELIDIAISKGITTIAITDHDNIDGIERAYNYVQGKDIELVPGIELSAHVSKGEMHILGLFLNFKDEVFQKIKRKTYEADDIIRHIKANGGLVILAHPQSLELSFEELRKKLQELKSYGLDGLECYHSNQTSEEMIEFKKIAGELDLLISKGSDYHGPKVKKDIDLGTGINGNIIIDENIENEIINKMKERLKK